MSAGQRHKDFARQQDDGVTKALLARAWKVQSDNPQESIRGRKKKTPAQSGLSFRPNSKRKNLHIDS